MAAAQSNRPAARRSASMPAGAAALGILGLAYILGIGISLCEAGWRLVADRPRPDGSLFAPWSLVLFSFLFIGPAVLALARGDRDYLMLGSAILLGVACLATAWSRRTRRAGDEPTPAEPPSPPV